MYFSGAIRKTIWDLTIRQYPLTCGEAGTFMEQGRGGVAPFCLVGYPALQFYQASNLWIFDPQTIDFLCSISLIMDTVWRRRRWMKQQLYQSRFVLCFLSTLPTCSISRHFVFSNTASKKPEPPACFVRKHQGVSSKSLSWCGDERRCGAVAHPFLMSSSKHRPNSFTNHRGCGRMESVRENGWEKGVENGSRAWTFNTCVVFLARLMSGGEQGVLAVYNESWGTDNHIRHRETLQPHVSTS